MSPNDSKKNKSSPSGPKAKPKAKAKLQDGKVVQRTRARTAVDSNKYLATLLDPVGTTGVGIPDSCMLKTSKFHIKHVVEVRSDSNGDAVFHLRPSIGQGALQVGGIRLGVDPTGNLPHYVRASSGGLPPGVIACAPLPVVNASDAAEIVNSFSSYRPVSFSVAFESTRPVLSAQGTLTGGLIPREAVPFVGELATTVVGGLVTEYQQGRGLVAAASARDVPRSVTIPSLDPMTVVWAPEDEQDRRFFGTRRNSPGDLIVDPGFTSSEWVNSITGNTDTYYAPFAAHLQTASLAGTVATDFEFGNVPTIMMTFAGCEPNTVLGLMTFEMNVEAIPLVESIFIESALTAENPLELAQADNVMRLIDKVQTPREPQSLGNLAAAAAESATTHLYDDKTSLKAAIEGTSIVPTFRGLVKSASSAAAPALAAVPNFGPALSMGASLLSAML